MIMKVAIYAPWIYLRGGAERVILELVTRSRHKWTIFTNYFSPQTTFEDFEKHEVVELSRISVKRDFLTLGITTLKIAKQKLPLKNFDLLVISTAGFGEFITISNRELPIICFCHTPLKIVHDAITRAFFLKEKPYMSAPFYFFEKIYRFFEKVAWNNFNYVLCNSNEVKKRILLATLTSPHKVEVLHPGVDLKKMHAGRHFDKYFLVPGRIMWHKNIELAITAFKEFVKKRKDFKLIIAGAVDEKSEPYLEKLRILSKGLNVKFKINPSEENLYSLYQNCYAVLFTALNEDWGLVPLEAMAFGKPIISVNQGGPKESIVDGKTGFLVKPEPLTICEKMLELVRDPSLTKKIGKEGRKHARRYSWDNFVKRFDEVIEKVASKT